MTELYKALVAFQAELTPVGKSASNPFFKSKYAPLHEVVALVNPLLAKHKLAVLQPMTELDGQPALKTIIAHESGEFIEEITPLFLVKNDPQAHGSAVTYARRYGLMSMLGIVADEDDDGNKASRQIKKEAIKEVNPQELLNIAKDDINKEFIVQGYDNAESKKAFVTKVLGHSTIDNINEAHEVMDQLESERI